MIDVYDPNDPKAPVRKAFRRNIPAGYVAVPDDYEPPPKPPPPPSVLRREVEPAPTGGHTADDGTEEQEN